MNMESVKIKEEREMKYANNINNIGMNIKARSKPINVVIKR